MTTPSGTSVLSTKVSLALSVRTNTPAMATALSALESLPNAEFGIDARSVRAAIEQDALQQALKLQEELRGLTESIKNMGRGVAVMVEAARRVEEVIEGDVVCIEGERSKSTLEEEQKLASVIAEAFQARDEALKRSETVRTFLEKFDLTEEENQLLEHYSFQEFEGEVTPAAVAEGMAFLDAMESIRRIRIELASTFGSSAAAELLQTGSSTDSNRLGASSALRMMESLANKQERANDRLYRWIQSYLNLNATALAHVPTSSAMARQGVHARMQQASLTDDQMDEALAHPFIKRSIAVLKHVPSYHNHILELISTQRRAELTRRFLLALTSGYDGMPPIEMKAHDPYNYIGDMLAFVFRSLSAEADLAYSLLDDITHQHPLPNDIDDINIATRPMTSLQMLSISISGVTRPLKARISQVLTSLATRPEHEDQEQEPSNPFSTAHSLLDEEVTLSRSRIVTLYSICGLLLFYHSAVRKSLCKLTTRHDPPTYLHDQDDENKLNLVDSILQCLQEASEAYSASLRVYTAMLQNYASISSDTEANLANAIILSVSEARLASPGFSLEDTGETTSLSLEFLCEIVYESALPKCTTLDDISVLKSSLASAKKAGLGTDSITKFTQQINSIQTQMISELVEMETSNVLHRCGIGALYESILNLEENPLPAEATLSSQPGLTPPEVQTSIKAFYDSLFSPPLPSFEDLKDPALKKQSRSRTAAEVANAYEKIYEKLVGEQGGYDDLTFLVHKPHQVKTLLAV